MKSNPEVLLDVPASTRSAARGYSEAIRCSGAPQRGRRDGAAPKQPHNLRVGRPAASSIPPGLFFFGTGGGNR